MGKVRWQDLAEHALRWERVMMGWPTGDAGTPKQLDPQAEAVHLAGLSKKEQDCMAGDRRREQLAKHSCGKLQLKPQKCVRYTGDATNWQLVPLIYR
jgi:hypothetical protein